MTSNAEGCPPCAAARKWEAAPPRKSVMGDGRGYSPETLEWIRKQDEAAPKGPMFKGLPVKGGKKNANTNPAT